MTNVHVLPCSWSRPGDPCACPIDAREPIERLRAVLAAATPGPWRTDYAPVLVVLRDVSLRATRRTDGVVVCYQDDADDAAAIDALGSLWPAMLAIRDAALVAVTVGADVAERKAPAAALREALIALGNRGADLDAAIVQHLGEEPPR